MLRSTQVLMLLAISASPVGAQQFVVGLTPGTRVRIARAASDTAARFSSAGPIGKQIQGKFVSLSRDSIVVQEKDDALPLSLPLSAVDHVDVAAGKGRVKSAALGALIGGALFAGIGAAADSRDTFFEDPRVVGAIVGGVIGVPLGGLIGLAVGTQRWRRADLPARLTIVPLRGGGAKVGLSLQF